MAKERTKPKAKLPVPRLRMKNPRSGNRRVEVNKCSGKGQSRTTRMLLNHKIIPSLARCCLITFFLLQGLIGLGNTASAQTVATLSIGVPCKGALSSNEDARYYQMGTVAGQHLVGTLDSLSDRLTSTQTISQTNQVFRDGFDGNAIDSAKWNTTLATSGVRWKGSSTEGPGDWGLLSGAPSYGSIKVGGSMATFTDTGATPCVFPYIFAGPPSMTSPFPPAGDFVLEVRMKYEKVTLYGTGLTIRYWPNSDPVGNNAPGDRNLTVFQLWQDTNGLVIYLVGAGTKTIGLNNLDFHTYKLECVDGIYSLFIDDSLALGPSTSSLRPDMMWVGNPVIGQHSGWTTFTVDYIEVASLSPTPTPTPAVVWSDDFETYQSGSFPSANWVPNANALDTANNYVDTSKAYSGSKSLRLYGRVGGCWGALAYRPINVKPPYYIEVRVNNGSENLSGCHPERAQILIYEGTSWTNPWRVFVTFDGDGQIRSSWDGGGTSDMSGPTGNRIVLGDYSPGIWYTVKVRYEILDASTVRLTYWIDDVYKAEQDFTVSSREASLTNLSLTVDEGTAWFDDVKVWAAGPSVTPTPTFTPAPISTTTQVPAPTLTLAPASTNTPAPTSTAQPGGLPGQGGFPLYIIGACVGGLVLVGTLSGHLWRRRQETLLLRRYKQKLEQWERDGYDVSDFNRKWLG